MRLEPLRRAAHFGLPTEVIHNMSDRRVEEEMRARLFHDEFYHGPFEVRGQEMRRIVGARATKEQV